MVEQSVLIRIRTKIDDKHRVYTLFHNGKWVTLITGSEAIDADTLFVAAQNHIRAAYDLREKVAPAKTWQERADRDGGFIDDDMGCEDDAVCADKD